jgi:Zn-finger nucleic acid-binding protein
MRGGGQAPTMGGMSLWGALLGSFAQTGRRARGGIGRCPSCDLVLSPAAGTLHEDICCRCQGRFVPVEGADLVIERIQGIDHDERIDMARRGTPEAPCPGCGSALSAAEIDEIPFKMCRGCGGLWLARGYLSVLSRGEVDELEVHERARSTELPHQGRSVVTLLSLRFPPPSPEEVRRLFDAFEQRGKHGGIVVGGGVIAHTVPEREAPLWAQHLSAGGLDVAIESGAFLQSVAVEPIRRFAINGAHLSVGGFTGDLVDVPWDDIGWIELGAIARPRKIAWKARAPSSGAVRASTLLEDRRRFEDRGLSFDLAPSLGMMRKSGPPRALRFDSVGLDFGGLGEQRTASASANFQSFVGEVLERTDAIHGQGLKLWQATDDMAALVYTRPNALPAELTWMRWRDERTSGEAEGRSAASDLEGAGGEARLRKRRRG